MESRRRQKLGSHWEINIATMRVSVSLNASENVLFVSGHVIWIQRFDQQSKLHLLFLYRCVFHTDIDKNLAARELLLTVVVGLD